MVIKKQNVNIAEMQILLEISEVVHSSTDIKKSFDQLMKIFVERLGVSRCALTLLDEGGSEVVVEAAYGLSEAEAERGVYHLGEGITGRVAETGQPMFVPDTSTEPLFLNKTKANRKDISFICVPIKIAKKTIGTISVDKLGKGHDLKQDVDLLTIISSMIAQTVRLSRDISKEKAQLESEARSLRKQLSGRFNVSNIIGNSSSMQGVYTQIIQSAKGIASIMVRGESGTGKELVASAIHYNSLRSEKPFVKVNCAAIPAELIESELFGHEKGSFTNAHQRKLGRFEQANGGTIFLDEIGDLSPATQVKLLRVLQEKEFERVGGTETLTSNFRLLSATNRNLEEMIAKGTFREDLYYRLNVFSIYLPALRERKTDILLLAEHFLGKYNKENEKKITRISTPAIDMMISYHWPGNVRELENCIERAVLICEEATIHSYHLPPTLQVAGEERLPRDQSFEERVSQFEKEIVVDSLRLSHGNVREAAKQLGTTVRILGYKMKSFSLDYRDFR